MRVGLGCLLFLLLAGCGEPEPLRLGFLGGLTGRYADFGTPGRNGALLAVERQNGKGGIGGTKIELLVRDDKTDPDVARKAVDDLLDKKVKAIIGPMFSSMGVAIAAKINEARVLTMGIATTTTLLSGQDDYFYRVIGTTDVYARNLAHYHFDRFGLRKSSLVLDVANREYTEAFAKEYEAVFTSLGGRVLSKVNFDSRGTPDYLEIAKSLLENRPDNITLACTSIDAALLAQTLRKLNKEIQLSGTGFAATERLVELGGDAVEGMLVEQFTNRFDRSPRYQEFRQDYLARFGSEPGYTGTLGFTATQAVLAVLEKDPAAGNLKARLAGLKRFQSVQGEIEFDEFGDAVRLPYMSEVRNGQFVEAR